MMGLKGNLFKANLKKSSCTCRAGGLENNGKVERYNHTPDSWSWSILGLLLRLEWEGRVSRGGSELCPRQAATLKGKTAAPFLYKKWLSYGVQAIRKQL